MKQRSVIAGKNVRRGSVSAGRKMRDAGRRGASRIRERSVSVVEKMRNRRKSSSLGGDAETDADEYEDYDDVVGDRKVKG